ncbi:5-aminolevulinate synthase [Xylariaceae sp. FL0594]|nr:5-aminolevulinate synthase [Xylariaceae sp. FL0594]
MGDMAKPVPCPNSSLVARIQAQRIISSKDDTDKSSLPAFYHHLAEALDGRRAVHNFFTLAQNSWQNSGHVDFCSGDILGLRSSDSRRAAFFAELTSQSEFATGSSGVRLMDGNYPYLEEAEREIASFHGAEAGLILGSAFEANVAVWTALPRPGDVIVYDELIHASSHEGFKQSLAVDKFMFLHNDIESFRSVLESVFHAHTMVKQGKRSILVAVESIYSMDGDVCPLQELVDVAYVVSGGRGNIQFVVDEAHCVGVIGPGGAGLVSMLGLQDEIAVVVHSYGKALGATGAIVLGRQLIKDALINFGRSVVYTTSPSLPFVAAIKSGYALLKSTQTQQAREKIQELAKTFFNCVTLHPLWPVSSQQGLLSVPLAEGWEDRDFLTHIITVSTRQQYTYWLYFHLQLESFSVFPVGYPVVPHGQSRMRIIMHAHNTQREVELLVEAIFAWVEEMLMLEKGGLAETPSKAASQVYEWMAQEGLSGFGMP